MTRPSRQATKTAKTVAADGAAKKYGQNEKMISNTINDKQ